ncbi:unnamed protein product [Darwinula stevensoni]|uniref:Uncharacterized protein n=1 Tax=Darwinula stevensoni TaxID=69355 RepID=A0A7R9FSP3_9CRUS|nr:unnamed protein product [Darwinula stevensoni]CAG0903932.1 unnamed protein product [Darwinula stevensoni]
MIPRILFIQMGGTIDKTYPRTRCGYSFEIGTEPAAKRILDRIRPGLSVETHIESVSRKDSLDITDRDRFPQSSNEGER